MGLVKFEVDIPNFEKELSINITIRRDGEVYYCTSSPSMVNNTDTSNSPSFLNLPSSCEISGIVDDTEDIKLEKKKVTRKKVEQTKPTQEEIAPKVVKPRGGNFMGMDF